MGGCRSKSNINEIIRYAGHILSVNSSRTVLIRYDEKSSIENIRFLDQSDFNLTKGERDSAQQLIEHVIYNENSQYLTAKIQGNKTNASIHVLGYAGTIFPSTIFTILLPNDIKASTLKFSDIGDPIRSSIVELFEG